MIIVTVAELTKCTAEQVKNTLKERVFHDLKRAKRYFTYVLGKPFWVEDKTFLLDDHFQVVNERISSKEELSTLAGKLVSTPFPARWPQWCIYVIEDFQGGSAVICKFHHSFLDGTAGVNAWVHASDPQCKREFFKMPKFSRARELLNTLIAAIYLPFYMLFRYFSKGDRNPLLGPALTGRKTLSWTRHYNLAQYKEKCRQKGITLNDLIGAAALRTLRKYIAETYGQNHENFTFFMPFSMRGQPEDGSRVPTDNDFAPILIEMPSAASETLENDCARTFNRIKHSLQPFLWRHGMDFLGFVPQCIGKWLLFSFASKATMVYSNVPGPRSLLSYQGARLVHVMTFTPVEAACGIGMTCLSYTEEFTVAIYADTGLVKEAGDFMRMLQTELDNA